MTNLENLKKLADGLGADASKCSTNLGALNVISKALGGAGDAETNSKAIEDIAQAAPAAMEQNVVWADDVPEELGNVTTPTPDFTAFIEELNIPEGVVTVKDGGLLGSSALKKVTFPKSVRYIGNGVGSACPVLEQVVIQEGVETIGSGLFGTSPVEELRIPSTVRTYGAAVGSNMNLKRVYFENGLENLSDGVYNGYKALEEVRLPNTLTAIPNSAFGGCVSMKNFNIPNSVESIADNAFDGCTALTEINIDKPENSISGAPWGATNAQVNWLG